MNKEFSTNSLKIFPNKWIVFCDICGLIAWVYAVFKLFIFDLDYYIVSELGINLNWMVQFRVLFVLGFLGAVGLIFGRKRLLGLVLYVLAFPMIVIFWKIPFVLIRIGSWTFGIAFVNWFLSLFTDLVYKAISATIYLSSFATILFSNDASFIAISCVALIVAILASYVRAAFTSFRAPRVLVVYRRVFSFISQMYASYKLEEAGPPGTHLTSMPADKIDTYAGTLQAKIAVNRATLFFAKKLEAYQKSQIPALSGLWMTFSLIVITLISFSFLYFGVHKFDSGAIRSIEEVSAFDYFQLAFDNMLFGSVGGIELISDHIRAISMLQRFLSVTTIGIFLGVFLTIRNRKYEEEIDETIEDIKRSGLGVESSIIKYYKYENIDEAIEDLVKIKSSAAGFLARLTASLK